MELASSLGVPIEANRFVGRAEPRPAMAGLEELLGGQARARPALLLPQQFALPLVEVCSADARPVHRHRLSSPPTAAATSHHRADRADRAHRASGQPTS